MNGNEEHNNLCVGIDLGTTNSVLAIINEKPNGNIVSKVVEIARSVDVYNNAFGDVKLTTRKEPTLPSCVYYRQEKEYEPLVGDFAKKQYPLRSYLVAKSIKSQMGNPIAIGLSPDVPDKKPAQIASRILQHMLREVSKVYRCKITDAVITVPANFDSAMCKATLDAAELAGIQVRNSDGSERPILLSEPNAVIYDLINQIQNGEIPNQILDLSEKKRVLVFDLGGGTLDITLHEIKRREDNPEILKVEDIAINRYTLLGGDDFDEAIANVMYHRYLKQYEHYPEVMIKLKKEKEVIMSQLRVYAEHLKLDLNEHCSHYHHDYNSTWDDEEDDEIATGGNMGGIGYSYDDTFRKEEIEQILSSFMATELTYNDYKTIDKIKDTKNIIYPILDVLRKASYKLNIEDVKVDEVIVNGGMSKFYMITERLKTFFGFDPLIALDPDQAVARGAAVYHYYLHKNEEIKDDMKLIHETSSIENHVERTPYQEKEQLEYKRFMTPYRSIQLGKSILNDSLYLGVKNGAVHMIIPTGAELPYSSSVMTGFKIEPGQNKIAIPIKSQNLDGTYRMIASGNIAFQKQYDKETYVAFIIQMNHNKIITMNAWTSTDRSGNNKIEEGYVEIAIDNNELQKEHREKAKIKAKFIAPNGTQLEPKAEINNLLQLYHNFEKTRNKMEKSKISKRIATCVNTICNAGNKKDFAEVILNALKQIISDNPRQKLFVIARKLGPSWDDKDKQALATACMNQIEAELHGLLIKGPRISTNIQAIYTLSMCATVEQLNTLTLLQNSHKYLQACLYTHAKTKTSIPWIIKEFDQDIKQTLYDSKRNLQFSAYAVGIAFRKNENSIVETQIETEIVQKICQVITLGKLTAAELTSCILALGWICDQRYGVTKLDRSIIEEVLDVIHNINQYYINLGTINYDKLRKIAIKMINGNFLDEEEEQFLLTKLEQ